MYNYVHVRTENMTHIGFPATAPRGARLVTYDDDKPTAAHNGAKDGIIQAAQG